ncbi:MAG: hypothetical protein CVT48_03465 [Thermoplasmata archaeon HGW-Thermoplasmata-1]|nr:MAG: hypothetical protein CVT48_03465 [Thermoplasmata archaeon HGW-Thermoplasmata-1]
MCNNPFKRTAVLGKSDNAKIGIIIDIVTETDGGIMMIKKYLVFALTCLFLAASMAGCIGSNSDSTGALVLEPETYAIEKMAELTDNVLFTGENYDAVPLYAPLYKNYLVRVALDVAPEGQTFNSVTFSDLSLFSSQLALAHATLKEQYPGGIAKVEGKVTACSGCGGCSNSCESEVEVTESCGCTTPRAIVVDGYETALSVGTLAWLLDASILVYGETTDEALYLIGATSAENVIVAGALPGDLYEGAKHLDSRDAILEETIDAASGAGVNLGYISVVNPYDDEGIECYYPDNNKSPYTPHLSCFGSMFAAMHDGITLTVEPVPEKIDKSIQATADSLKAAGMTPTHLLMLGDSVSLPFVYYWIESYEDLGQIPTDNVYADLEEQNPNYNQTKTEEGYPEAALTIELANGRVIARTLGALTDYFYTMVDYTTLLANPVAPSPATPALDLEEWNNNALAYCSTAAEFGAPEEVEGWLMLFNEGGFNAQEGSAVGHLGLPVSGIAWPSGTVLAELFAMSNFIIAGADHGCPQGNSVGYDQLVEMPPNVNFQISCMTGQIDNHKSDRAVTKEDSYTYMMMEKGAGAYVAAMRTTMGTIPSSSPMTGQTTGTSGEMAYYFYEELIKNDFTVGEAIQNAKARVYADPNIPSDESVTAGNNNIQVVVKLEYMLYGDPGFNPYEPCNEGSA